MLSNMLNAYNGLSVYYVLWFLVSLKKKLYKLCIFKL